jgi:hypothetical protein
LKPRTHWREKLAVQGSEIGTRWPIGNVASGQCKERHFVGQLMRIAAPQGLGIGLNGFQ